MPQIEHVTDRHEFYYLFYSSKQRSGENWQQQSKHSKKEIDKMAERNAFNLFSTEFSFKTPQNWAFFIWTFSLFSSFFFPPPSFIQQTRPDVSVHCRPGWRLVFIVIFLIYYLFSFYFVLCVFQLLSIGEAGLKVPHSCGGKKKKKSYVTFSIYKRL